MSTNIKISLTNFLDFVSTSGPSRVGQVRKAQLQSRERYSPGKDYWRQLRKAIVDFHSGAVDWDDVEQTPAAVSPARRVNYRAAIKAYKKFLGRKDITYFPVTSKPWVADDVTITVNPELGLMINDEKHFVKLYPKKEPISKKRAQAALFLMYTTMGCKASGATASIIDIQQGQIYSSKSMSKDQEIFLIGEARSFSGIWRAVDE